MKLLFEYYNDGSKTTNVWINNTKYKILNTLSNSYSGDIPKDFPDSTTEYALEEVIQRSNPISRESFRKLIKLYGAGSTDFYYNQYIQDPIEFKRVSPTASKEFKQLIEAIIQEEQLNEAT